MIKGVRGVKNNWKPSLTNIRKMKLHMGKSIATKMIIWGIIMVLLIFGTLETIVLSFSKNTLINITTKQSKMLTEQYTASVDEWINSIATQVKGSAAKNVMRTNIDTLVKDEFKLLRQSFPEIKKIHLVNGKTGIEEYSLTTMNFTNFNDKTFFKEAVSQKQTIISGEDIQPHVEKSYGYIATPVGPSNSDTSRILIVAFSMQKMLDRIAGVQFMENGYGYVLNENGLVVAHKNEEYTNNVEIGSDPAYKEIMQKVIDRSSTNVIYTDNGIESFASIAPLKTLPWSLVLSTSLSEIYGEVNSMGWIIFLVSIPVTVLAGAAIWWYANSMKRQLITVTTQMQRVGSGDFTTNIEVQGKDEIAQVGQALNQMVGELKDLITRVQSQAVVLNVASGELQKHSEANTVSLHQISGTLTGISERISMQNREVQSTVTTVSEISEGVEQVAISAEATSNATSKTLERAQVGMKQVQDVVEVVRGVTSEIGQNANRMHTLRQRSNEISEIVKMITGIASQTNLLALNAAIEAARAGEAGKGFSVVASEVRKLAEESSSFSEKIAAIAGSINYEAKEMTINMDDVVKQADVGLKSVEMVGQSFTHILQEIQAAAEQSESMTAISEEMAAGNQVVSSSMQNLSQRSGEIDQSLIEAVTTIEAQLKAISEINKNVQSMQELSNDLEAHVSKFQV
ncbi:methyl-accepting chemotaxis protein [Brevibacillus laterosporus]|uniref:methyl-accepting chemotaxis protein n=1 Tax=Brevibacillus laterosporus TaxID=1465 RepID=UPI001EF192BB|nr:methyl-accepting chemotaxis protein [Brevibacillus laterosporus]